MLFVSRVADRFVATRLASVVAREQRTEAAALVSLAPLPVTVPIVERPGRDSFGYPLSYVDTSALRSLLGRTKYRELSTYIEQFQAKAAADFHEEYSIDDGADAFESAERQIEPSLDAWVKATPNSFAPYLARGAHRFALGFCAARLRVRAKDRVRQLYRHGCSVRARLQ